MCSCTACAGKSIPTTRASKPSVASAMSSNPDVVSLRRSLALRLGLWQALLFGVAAAAMFAAVYLFLSRTLEAREREALELRAEEYANAFDLAGVIGVRSLLDQERE